METEKNEIGEGEKLYRSGVKFIKVYPEGMDKLKDFPSVRNPLGIYKYF